MKISDTVIFDSNILVYANNEASQFHKKCSGLIKAAVEGNFKAVLTHQNLLEFYSVITDSRRIEKPISDKDAQDLVANYLNSPLEIIYPNSETFKYLFILAEAVNLKGSKIFDVFLAATMLSNNISNIITANTRDFKGFLNIKVMDLKSL